MKSVHRHGGDCDAPPQRSCLQTGVLCVGRLGRFCGDSRHTAESETLPNSSAEVRMEIHIGAKNVPSRAYANKRATLLQDLFSRPVLSSLQQRNNKGGARQTNISQPCLPHGEELTSRRPRSAATRKQLTAQAPAPAPAHRRPQSARCSSCKEQAIHDANDAAPGSRGS